LRLPPPLPELDDDALIFCDTCPSNAIHLDQCIPRWQAKYQQIVVPQLIHPLRPKSLEEAMKAMNDKVIGDDLVPEGCKQYFRQVAHDRATKEVDIVEQAMRDIYWLAKSCYSGAETGDFTTSTDTTAT
jgi:hypothetical protein